MLSKEQTFFLSVLADHLNGRPTAPVPGVDWDVVLRLTQHHVLTALFYAQCASCLPSEKKRTFLQYYGEALACYVNREKLAAELEREFTRQCIPYVIVKGLTVAQIYPRPEVRTMGDLDIVVKAEDKEKAHALLQQLGFHNTQQLNCEWTYCKGSHMIELHHQLLYDEPGNTPAAKILASRIWEYARPVSGSSRHELDCNFHFLFLVMHLKKHIIHCGAGFRMFMDLAMAARHWPIKWAQVESWLTDVDMYSFLEVSLTLCRKWFQLELPLSNKNLTAELEQEITDQIFRNGVFGFDDKANADNIIIAEFENRKSDRLLSRLRVCRIFITRAFPKTGRLSYLRQILFPSYACMQKMRGYRFVTGRPWLLPVAWIWLLMNHIFLRLKKIATTLLFRRNRIRKRRENLKKMGL